MQANSIGTSPVGLGSEELPTDDLACSGGDDFKGFLQIQLHAAQKALFAEHEAAQRSLAASHERTIGLVAERVELVRLEAQRAAQVDTSDASKASAVPLQLSNGSVKLASQECSLDDIPTTALGGVKIGLDSTAKRMSPAMADTSEPSQCKPDDGISEPGSDSGTSAGAMVRRSSSKHSAESASSAHGMQRPRKSVTHAESVQPPGRSDRNSAKSDYSKSEQRNTRSSSGSTDGEHGRGSKLSGKYSHMMQKYSVSKTADDYDVAATQFEVLPVWNFRSSHCALPFGHSRLSRVRSKVLGSSLAKGKSCESVETSTWGKTHSLHLAQAFEGYNCLKMPSQVTLSPNSAKRAFWDFMSLALVAYDMVMIPLQQFDPPPNFTTDVMEWITRFFWTLDIPMSTVTGYITMEGSIELRLSNIIQRYLRTWFALDITIVSLDWLEIIMQSAQGVEALRMGKASRIFRIIRMVRLLRLVRIQQIVTIITERICSERLIIVADILKIMVLIVGIAHVLGCMWWGIGSVEDDPDTWVAHYLYVNQTLAVQYTMSLHWSLSQFTGGMDEVTPKNSGERIYTIIVFIFGFITASLFLGSLTSSMTQLQIIGTNQSQQLAILRKYLRQNQITNKLALRVQRNAKHVLQEQQRFMPEASVELLTMVSEPLRVEIHFEMYSAVFARHPFFAHYIEACPQVMRKVCHEAMSSLPVSSGDIIFNAGEIPSHPKMYFIGKGDFRYTSIFDDEFSITEGWLSEAALWTSWMHRGMLMASGECRVFVLDSKSFQRIVTEFDHPDFDPLLYAKDFVAELNRCGGDVSDLHMAKDEEDQWGRRSSSDGTFKNIIFGKGKRNSGSVGERSMESSLSDPSPSANNSYASEGSRASRMVETRSSRFRSTFIYKSTGTS